METLNKNDNFVNTIIDTISSIFLPLVNLLSASGIMKGLLAIALSVNFMNEGEGAYVVFNAMADSLFYFLPILLAFTSAKKFNANPYTAVVIAGVLLYPSLSEYFEASQSINFFSLSIPPVNYPSNVIVIIMAVGLLHYLEKGLNVFLPEIIKGFFTPIISIILVSLTSLFVFGPLGTTIGDILALGYETVYSASPVIAGIILGGVIQIMVLFGFHWSLIPLAINNIALNGSDTILALMGPAVFAQAGAALAVMLKSKDKEFKSVALSASISAFFGITEPASYAVNLPLKKPMIAVCIGGAIGGGIAGFAGSAAISFAFPGLVTIPVFLGNGFIGYIISIVVGFVVSFVITLLWKFEVIQQKETV